MECFVHAWLDQQLVPAGKLRWSGQQIEFWYGQHFLKKGYALDPIALPLSDQVFTAEYHLQGALAAFGDALPDHWGRYVLSQQFCQQLSDYEVLLADNHVLRMGALHFCQKSQVSETATVSTMQRLHDFSAWLKQGGEIPEGLHLEWGSSAGGARPKLSVCMNNQVGLVKFPLKTDMTDYAYIEQGSLKLAQACGIPVVDSCVIALGHHVNALWVRRFDRQHQQRLHYLSGHTLCRVMRDSRQLVINDTRSYLKFAEELLRISAAPQQDVHDLYRRMVFNVLINNHDDHVQNHGVIRHLDGQWRLSPAFDIVAGEGQRAGQALVVGRYGDASTLENLLSAVDVFQLTPRQAEAMIDELLAVLPHWHAIFRQAGVPETVIEQINWAIKDHF